MIYKSEKEKQRKLEIKKTVKGLNEGYELEGYYVVNETLFLLMSHVALCAIFSVFLFLKKMYF